MRNEAHPHTRKKNEHKKTLKQQSKNGARYQSMSKPVYSSCTAKVSFSLSILLLG